MKRWEPIGDAASYKALVYIGKNGRYIEMGGEGLTLPENMAVCRAVKVPDVPTVTLDAATVEALRRAIETGDSFCSEYHYDHQGDHCPELDPLRRLLAQVTGG